MKNKCPFVTVLQIQVRSMQRKIIKYLFLSKKTNFKILLFLLNVIYNFIYIFKQDEIKHKQKCLKYMSACIY